MIEGKNLLLKMEQVESDEERMLKHGVLVLRYVEAIDETLAAHQALEDFRCEPKGKALQDSLLNTSEDPAVFSTSKVTHLDSFDGISNLNPGLIFLSRRRGRMTSSSTTRLEIHGVRRSFGATIALTDLELTIALDASWTAVAKRSATPLLAGRTQVPERVLPCESAVAAALCRRSPGRFMFSDDSTMLRVAAQIHAT